MISLKKFKNSHKNDTWKEEVQVSAVTKEAKLPTLSYRRTRGDMIETYKLLSGVYDDQVSLQLNINIAGEYYTRGNSWKITVMRW